MFTIALKPVQSQISELSSKLSGPIANMPFADQSLLFAELSCLAYFDEPTTDAKAKAMGFTMGRKVRSASGDLLATVFIGHHDVVIALKGTEDFIDVKTDFDLDLQKDGDLPGLVHDGFRKQATLVWPNVAPILDTADNVWLTGHSMGAALAGIMAIRAARGEGPNARGLWSFGMPRIGNLAYVLNSKTPHYRWVHHHDLVTHVPTKWMGYQHFGTEVYISGSEVKINTILNRVKRFFSRLFDKLALDGAVDHNIVAYRNVIFWSNKKGTNG